MTDTDTYTVKGIEAGIARKYKIGTPVAGKGLAQSVTEAQHEKIKVLVSKTLRAARKAPHKPSVSVTGASGDGLRTRLLGEAAKLEARAKVLRHAASAL